MKKQLVALLIALSIAVPVFAQDVTDEPPAPTAVETVAPTAEPTVAPTETPAPAPTPSPVDLSLLLPWILTIVIVALVAVAGVAWVGIVQAAKGAPAWLRPIILANLKSGVDTLDDLTDGAIADAGIAELRKKLAELEAELNATKVQVKVNTQDIAVTASKVG